MTNIKKNTAYEINRILGQIAKRAEKLEGQYIVESFVDAGALFDSVTVKENSVIFGRRGTGKTHLLRFISEKMKEKGDMSIYIDLRTIGSNGGLYSEKNTPETQRATTLLVDTLQAIYTGIRQECFEFSDNTDTDIDIETMLKALDDFIDAASQTKVNGVTKKTVETNTENKIVDKLSCELKLQLDTLIAQGAMSTELLKALTVKETNEVVGQEEYHIIYPDIAKPTKSINSCLKKNKLWLLIDEWAEIPLDLQPYLADMIKRVFFAHHNIIIKIGAIENKSKFQKHVNTGYSLGIELGADASSHISLDEFMVFDNDATKSKNFFTNLIHKHALAFDDNNFISESTARFINKAFTQDNATNEFAMSCEGVARDALSIISECALKAENKKISIPIIRRSAKDCFIRTKRNAIDSMPNATNLLNWIIDDVIKGRAAKAFMLESNIRDPLIDFLFDNRVLHIIKQGVSAQDIVGRRYNVYSIDYGCYVDLLSTNYKPHGLLPEEDDNGNVNFVDVPKSDYRSIRRAILDLDEFYKKV